jgi:hypothetical protein
VCWQIVFLVIEVGIDNDHIKKYRKYLLNGKKQTNPKANYKDD